MKNNALAGGLKALVAVALAVCAFAVLGADAQKISALRASETGWQFLVKLPGSVEAQIAYMGALGVSVGMIFSWLGKWKIGAADLSYFVDNFRWTMGSFISALGAVVGGIATGAYETSGGEFVGWWSVLYHAAAMGGAVDWAMNKGKADAHP